MWRWCGDDAGDDDGGGGDCDGDDVMMVMEVPWRCWWLRYARSTKNFQEIILKTLNS